MRLVIVKDINTGKETIVRQFSIAEKGNIWLANNSVFKGGNFIGEVFIAKGPDDNLVFGESSENILYLYNPVKNVEEPPIHIIVKATKVTPQYIATFKTRYLKNLGDHLAYYSDILTDPEGHIVLMRGKGLNACIEARALIIKKNGAAQHNVKLKTEGFTWWENDKFKSFSFYTKHIAFALVKDPDDDEDLFRLEKLQVSGL